MAESASEPEPEPRFDKPKHIRYWLRMFKTVLPTHYQSTDSNRMFITFTILSSLDILGILHSASSPITAAERADAAAWIYAQQHPGGGFRAFPGTKFKTDADPAGERNTRVGGEDAVAYLDPANAAGTCFALASLVVLRDDLKGIEREKCARWLKKLQDAETGSFAEVLGRDGGPWGQMDVRHSYFAVATQYVLRAIEGVDREAGNGEDEFDTEGLVWSVLDCQNYDGGISGEPGTESHGGYAYCAVGCLSLLGELPYDDSRRNNGETRTSEFVRRLVPDLVSHQVPWIDSEDDDDDDEDEDEDEGRKPPQQKPSSSDHPPEPELPITSRWVGFDGRCNKPADTCYTFWVGACLAILGLSDTLIDPVSHRRFLLERTEHRIGGFGKTPGDPPDALHSFMGLLALALMHEPGLESVDPSMAMTQASRDHLEEIRKKN